MFPAASRAVWGTQQMPNQGSGSHSRTAGYTQGWVEGPELGRGRTWQAAGGGRGHSIGLQPVVVRPSRVQIVGPGPTASRGKVNPGLKNPHLHLTHCNSYAPGGMIHA